MIEDGLNGDRSTGHGPLPGGEGGRSTPGESPEEAPTSAISSGNIRVDVGLLDRLMNLVGELVLARNQILQHASSRGDLALMGTSRRLDLITTELQEGVMKTRMQPIGNIWSTLPRVVRDLSLICGKQVRVEMEGNETELDRTIIESIKDPLTHLVRNAVDHGIEAPEERVRRGKSAAGCLRLRAFHESGQVIIEIADDGAGLDVDRITRRALERGIITREQSARRSDHELMQLIFLPGFSTAEKVTNVSGRGVGMDVVRTNIEKIGGTIEMTTRPGQGTSFKVKIPLTLAIIPALIVSAGGESFAIPQVNLLELVRLERDQARRAIETIRGAAIFRLRGDLLPLVRLDQMLGLGDANRGTGGGRMLDQFDAVNIVVLQTDGRRFGLVVDAINDTEEIVVKPLGKQLKGLSLFAGATIMGDGRVSLILDASGIAQRAGVVSATGRAGSGRDGAGSKPTDEPKTAYLLLRQGDEGRAAIPLSHVARLEEIPLASIEYSADREVVQYRERILPLVRLSRATGRGQRLTDERSDPMQVVVYTQGGLSVGLVVDEILDIIEDAVQVKPIRSGRGLLGTAVIHHRVTDVLDIPDLIRATDPELACVGTGSGD
jgi:two-component system chemotaxis sensor kinase CheA